MKCPHCNKEVTIAPNYKLKKPKEVKVKVKAKAKKEAS